MDIGILGLIFAVALTLAVAAIIMQPKGVQKVTKLGAAFAGGLIFPLMFFYSNDPDRANLFGFVFLFAIAAVICASWETTFLVNAMAVVLMIPGFFVGTCVALIVYFPEPSNLLPIAAASWTILSSVPIILGAILGPLFKKFL